VIFVSVKSLFCGKNDLTPDTKFSKLAPIPASLRPEVRREEIAEKPLKRSVDVEVCAGPEVGAEDIIVERVTWRTRLM